MQHDWFLLVSTVILVQKYLDRIFGHVDSGTLSTVVVQKRRMLNSVFLDFQITVKCSLFFLFGWETPITALATTGSGNVPYPTPGVRHVSRPCGAPFLAGVAGLPP